MVIAALVASALPAAAAPAVSLSAVASAEIAACLQGERWRPDARHLAASAQDAPGLPAHMEIARIADAPGRLFVYQDAGGSVIECGAAVYDALPPDLESAAGLAVRTARPHFVRHDPDAWRVDGRGEGRAVYWGDPGAPGLSGVLLREGGDGEHAPRLQIDSHTVLIR